ncbi:MAG: hypothetical protein K9N51_10160 [Candidatus Pacebacteria bacterium]|nr:hypothetical protein [Candidatus Paceibacterota bacterium]
MQRPNKVETREWFLRCLATVCAILAVVGGSAQAAYMVGHTWNLADDFDSPVALPAQSDDSEGNTVWSYRWLGQVSDPVTFRTDYTPDQVNYSLMNSATQDAPGGYYHTQYDNDDNRHHRVHSDNKSHSAIGDT